MVASVQKEGAVVGDAPGHSNDQRQDNDFWKYWFQQGIHLAISRVDELPNGVRNIICATGRILYP
jgi:hypothetical protein